MTQRHTREKRDRPPMPPLAVRVQVAERQYCAMFPKAMPPHKIPPVFDLLSSAGKRLNYMLKCMFDKPNLDHDPALILRQYNPRIKDVASRYTPHAHDPDALIYREKADHGKKTTGRNPGAAKTITTKGSDAHLAAKFRRLEGKNKPKRKVKIQGRPFGPQKRTFGR